MATQNNAPTNLDLTNCFVSSDGGNTRISLSDIKTASDTATAKVTDLETKIGENVEVDTSNFLKKDQGNKPNGFMLTTASNDICFPMNTNSNVESWVNYGLNPETNQKYPSYIRTICQYHINSADAPYQEMVLSYSGQDRFKQIWGSGICPANVNDTDLGRADRPFRDLWISNAPNVISDKTTKNVITGEISGSDYSKLLDAVYSVSASLYTLKAAVSEKGEELARLHSGFIAQQLEASLIDKELDPSDFAFWCKSETYKEIQHDIVDKDGKTTTISTYEVETGSDGEIIYKQSLRYEELFVLLIEAMKVKLSEFETRLSKLENN